MITEQQKFDAWCTEEKEKGLIDFKLFAGSLSEKETLEDAFSQLNEVNKLLENPEAFKRKPDVF